MRVKKYVVNTIADAMPMIKQELGQDAIILNTKKIKVGGFLGLFRKEQLEVIAASDQEKSIQENNSTHSFSSTLKKSNPNSHDSLESIAGNHSLELKEEIRKMKTLIHTMVTDKNDKLPVPLQQLTIFLEEQEIDSDIITQIIPNISLKMKEDNGNDIDQKIYGWMKDELLNILNSAEEKKLLFAGNHTFSKITSFVGPTGVGKTTTIAKLAADMMLNHKKQVGFITTDTYRIAAVEQLKTYANILNIPIEVVFAPEEVKQAMEKLKECDLIFMDTAGRNYFQTEYIEQMKPMLPKVEMETYLVLSLTSKYSDIVKLLDNFEKLPIQKLILTKLDETNTFGSIINLLYNRSIPLSYITTGQNVPDDITQPDAEFIVEQMITKMKDLKVIGEDANERSS